jgi:hypothetical protein
MYRRLVRVEVSERALRPARVIALEARRRARLEAARPKRQPPRHAG